MRAMPRSARRCGRAARRSRACSCRGGSGPRPRPTSCAPPRSRSARPGSRRAASSLRVAHERLDRRERVLEVSASVSTSTISAASTPEGSRSGDIVEITPSIVSSMYSRAEAGRPARTIASATAPALSSCGKPQTTMPVTSGTGSSDERGRHDCERPLRADDERPQVERVELVEPGHAAVGQHDLQPAHVVGRDAVRQAVQPAGVRRRCSRRSSRRGATRGRARSGGPCRRAAASSAKFVRPGSTRAVRSSRSSSRMRAMRLNASTSAPARIVSRPVREVARRHARRRRRLARRRCAARFLDVPAPSGIREGGGAAKRIHARRTARRSLGIGAPLAPASERARGAPRSTTPIQSGGGDSSAK